MLQKLIDFVGKKKAKSSKIMISFFFANKINQFLKHAI
jgi:hypothetical protein